MSLDVDARGLNCPQPVIATKKALDGIQEGVVTTIVDNTTAKENVVKFASASNCGVSVTEKEGHFYIKITKGKGEHPQKAAQAQKTSDGKLVFLITQNTMGHGSGELGGVLMNSFMFTLLETAPRPDKLLFINSGVKLTTEGSPVLEHLRQMTEQGVEILSCGTCLDFYNLKDKLSVGSVTNMYSIVEELSSASRAVTI